MHMVCVTVCWNTTSTHLETVAFLRELRQADDLTGAYMNSEFLPHSCGYCALFLVTDQTP